MTDAPEKPPEREAISTPTSQDPEVALAALMREYKANTEARAMALAQVNAEMDALSSRMNVLALPYEVMQNDLYGKIEALALERGAKMLEADPKATTGFICESGKITYFRPGIKRSWELDPLDRVCDSDPYVKERIWCFRNAAPILPRITLKVE